MGQGQTQRHARSCSRGTETAHRRCRFVAAYKQTAQHITSQMNNWCNRLGIARGHARKNSRNWSIRTHSKSATAAGTHRWNHQSKRAYNDTLNDGTYIPAGTCTGHLALHPYNIDSKHGNPRGAADFRHFFGRRSRSITKAVSVLRYLAFTTRSAEEIVKHKAGTLISSSRATFGVRFPFTSFLHFVKREAAPFSLVREVARQRAKKQEIESLPFRALIINATTLR